MSDVTEKEQVPLKRARRIGVIMTGRGGDLGEPAAGPRLCRRTLSWSQARARARTRTHAAQSRMNIMQVRAVFAYKYRRGRRKRVRARAGVRARVRVTGPISFRTIFQGKGGWVVIW